jgi:hypothetical protein
MSTASSIDDSSTPIIAPSTLGLSDFSDRLPPMLVKELRQGMRARTFVAVFLGLQCFLAIVMLFATSATTLGGAGNAVSQIIFLFFSLAVLVVQPLRAMNALHAEIKSTTIDMMVLTRLTARRIVAGKWASIVAQTLLLLVSIIPYLILRYFFGGMNLFSELTALISIAVLSACLTAVNVGLSANGSLLVRGFLPLVIALMMFSLSMTITGNFDELVQFFALDQAESLALFFGLLIGSLYLGWNFFHLGVKAIAPASENHSSLNRLICLITMAIIAALVVGLNGDLDMLPYLLGAIAAPGALLALTEPNAMMPRLAMPFVKRGISGRFIGAFFYPCWTAGIHFTGLLIFLLLAVTSWLHWFDPSGVLDDDGFIVMTSLIGSALFPALFVAMLQKRSTNPLGLYVAILVGSFCVMLALIALAESTDAEGAMMLFFWLPPVHLYLMGENTFDSFTVLAVSCVVMSLYLLILLIHGWRNWRTIRDAETQAEALILPPQTNREEPDEARLAE